MIKATYILISSDEWHNTFMTAADLFEKGKVLGTVEILEVSYKEGTRLTFKRASAPIRQIEKLKGRIVSFFHLVSIQNDNLVTFNDGSVRPYINLAVRIISTGREWYMLKDYLRWLGLKVETDEFMYIKNVV